MIFMFWINFIYPRSYFGIDGIKGMHTPVSNVEQEASAGTGWIVSCIILHYTP